jgi:hypothetical protein
MPPFLGGLPDVACLIAMRWLPGPDSNQRATGYKPVAPSRARFEASVTIGASAASGKVGARNLFLYSPVAPSTADLGEGVLN